MGLITVPKYQIHTFKSHNEIDMVGKGLGVQTLLLNKTGVNIFSVPNILQDFLTCRITIDI